MRIVFSLIMSVVALRAAGPDSTSAPTVTSSEVSSDASVSEETTEAPATTTMAPTTEPPTTTPAPAAVASTEAAVGPVDMESPGLGRGRRGIVNLGLTCHMNVALQILTHSRALRALLLPIAAAPLPLMGSEDRINAVRVVNELARIFETQWGDNDLSSSAVPIDATALLDAVRTMVGYGFVAHEMEDAQRSVGALMEAITTALAPAQGGQSPFEALMGSTLVKTLTCPATNQTRTVRELTLELQLPLNPYKQHMPLAESFGLFLSGEVLEGVECSSCLARHDTPVAHSLEPANLLLLSIKRHGPDGRKIGTWIHYPLEFNMADYIPGAVGMYRLTGIVHHVGPAGLGHYLADWLHPDDGKWYRADDRRITPIAGGRPVPSGPSQTALVYERFA